MLNGKKATYYDELYAKNILLKYCSDMYKSFEHQDKPDLIDVKNKIGVEVTTAINKDKANELYSWARKNDITKDVSLIKDVCLIEDIKSIVEQKNDKFITYNMPVIDLFVNAEYYSKLNTKEEIENFELELCNYLKEIKCNYRYVIIVTLNYIFVFDAISFHCKTYFEFTTEVQSDLSKETLKEVEEL